MLVAGATELATEVVTSVLLPDVPRKSKPSSYVNKLILFTGSTGAGGM